MASSGHTRVRALHVCVSQRVLMCRRVDAEWICSRKDQQEAKRKVEREKRKLEGDERRDKKKRKVEAAWSEQVARKEGKVKRKEKKIAKRKWLNAQKKAGETVVRAQQPWSAHAPRAGGACHPAQLAPNLPSSPKALCPELLEKHCTWL